MPRMQVYLPESLYREVKKRRMFATEILARAVVAEVRRLELEVRTDECLTEMLAEVGEPSQADAAAAAMGLS